MRCATEGHCVRDWQCRAFGGVVLITTVPMGLDHVAVHNLPSSSGHILDVLCMQYSQNVVGKCT